MSRETKTAHVELKQVSEAGEVEAVIATLGVIDADGDIMEPGSFAGKALHILPTHDAWSAPMGKVTMFEEGGEAIARGRFNLKVSHGKDWYEAVKFDLDNPPALQEWSFDLMNIKGEADTVDGQSVRRIFAFDSKEISPVLRGAGVNTRTLAVKSLDPHKTETSDAPWDEIAASLEAKEFDRFAHHFEGGAASTRACLLGIFRLNNEDLTGRKTLYEHLASHLKDAGIDPPELQPSGNRSGVKLVDRIRFATWEVETAIENIRAADQQRKERGRSLSEATRAESVKMATAFEEMHIAAKKLAAMVDASSDEPAVAEALSTWAVTKARLTRSGLVP